MSPRSSRSSRRPADASATGAASRRFTLPMYLSATANCTMRRWRSCGRIQGEEFMPPPRTMEWIGDADGFVRLIDQTQLPTTLTYRDCPTVEDVWEAIRSLRVRGAPAIGVAAAMGVVIGVQACADATRYGKRLREVTTYLRTSRPTAVNLFWALERMERCFEQQCRQGSPQDWTRGLLAEALAIQDEDRRMCRAIGAAG